MSIPLQEDIKNVPYLHPVQNNVPSNEEYSGPYDFEVEIYPNGTKNPWVVSAFTYIFFKLIETIYKTY